MADGAWRGGSWVDEYGLAGTLTTTSEPNEILDGYRRI
jgi:hypothetical protein